MNFSGKKAALTGKRTRSRKLMVEVGLKGIYGPGRL